METYHITSGDTRIICTDKVSVLQWLDFFIQSGLTPNVEKVFDSGEQVKYFSLSQGDETMDEIYEFADPKNCPHPLHKMSIEEYKRRMIAQAEIS